LVCKIQNYAWGSRSFIAKLQGRAVPAPQPEAELWIGAHTGAPAELVQGEARRRLDTVIASNSEAALGSEVAQRFNGELPFLLKLLAAAEPLSLQAHPSAEQARAGFEREEAAQVDPALRNYKDARHKPELIVALTPFVALSGFRPVERTRRLIAELGVQTLSSVTAPLAEEPAEPALRTVFERLMQTDGVERAALVREVRAAAAEQAPRSSDFSREFAWVERLHALYPGDIGVVVALFLNLLELRPFEGLYLPAGNLHAYLDGAGVEIMASSDNVLRGGLTKKAVNIAELMRVLRFAELEVASLSPERIGDEHVYPTPAEEFRLSYIVVRAPLSRSRGRGPELRVVTGGRVRVEGEASALLLEAGGSAFVPASEGALRVEGQGTLFRACVPEATLESRR
jgi:mannose-6-phosphate isomerase